MFSRMQDIQRGALDEEGVSINQVERSLKRVNIALRESDDTFRNFEDVLDDVSKGWKTYDDVTKADIKKTIAGIRQAEIFTALMSNRAMVQDLLNEQINAGGMALDRYDDYLQGVEASENRLTVATEAMWQATMNEGVIVFWNNLTASVYNAIASVGGLVPVITTVLGLFVLFNQSLVAGAWASLAASITKTISGLIAMGVQASITGTLMATAFGPIGIALLAVGGAMAYVSYQSHALEERINETRKVIGETGSEINRLEKSRSTISSLYKEFDELRKKTRLSSVEQERFTSIQNQLKDLVPTVAGSFNEYGDFILKSSVNMASLNKETEKQIENEKELQRIAIEKGAGDIASTFEKDSAEYERRLQLLNDIQWATEQGLNVVNSANEGWVNVTAESLRKAELDFKEFAIGLGTTTDQIKADFMALDEVGQARMIATFEKAGVAGEKMAKILKSLTVNMAIPYQLEQWQKDQDRIVGSMEETVEIVSEESKKAFDDILKYTIDMIKQSKKNEIDLLKTRLDSLKEWRDGLKDSYEFQHSEEKRLRDAEKDRLKNQLNDLKYIISEKKRAANEEYDQIKRNFELQKDQLRSQLDGYNDLIDAQIELLRQKKSELDFAREMEDKQSALAEIQARILELSFDDSEEAIRQRLLLEQQAAEMQQAIDEAIVDNEIEQQIRVLEQAKENAQVEYELQLAAIEAAQQAAETQHELRIRELEEEERVAERKYELRIQQLEEEQKASDYLLEMNKRRLEEEYAIKEKGLQSQIDQLQKYLDEEGTIANDARKMLAKDSENTYKQLMEWNKKYGDGLSETIVNGWALALDALNEYKASLASMEIPDFSDLVASLPSSIWWNGAPGQEEHHSGIDSGFVGGVRGDEKIIKALKGELVLNQADMNNFTERVLPSMMGNNSFERNGSSGDITLNVPISVLGNLDEKVLPDLKTIMRNVVQELNKSVSNRGFVRQTSLTSV